MSAMKNRSYDVVSNVNVPNPVVVPERLVTNPGVARVEMSEDLKLSGVEMVVDVAPLNVDYSYQRAIRNHHHHIDKQWNPAAAGRLLVGRRPDRSLWIIDGQQRREAMLSRKIHRWKALVIESSGPEYEAEIYVIVNGGRGTTKPLTHREQFKGLLAASDPTALKVVELCASHGLKIHAGSGGFRPVWPYIGCTKWLMDAMTRWGEGAIGDALEVATKAFPENYRATDASVLQALVHALHFRKADKTRLIEKLSEHPLDRLLQEAKLIGANNGPGTTAAFYTVIAARYNRKLKPLARIPDKMSQGVGQKLIHKQKKEQDDSTPST